MIERQKGDKYRPVVRVLKAKKGVPTKINVSGNEYALIHPDYVNGNKNKNRRLNNDRTKWR